MCLKNLEWASKSSYLPQNIVDNDLVAILKSKITLKLNKLIYVGMCVLGLSKVLMYEFHYDYIKNKYGNKSKIWFIDTDRLMYEIKTEYVYENLNVDKEIFDFSNYLAKSFEQVND